MLNLSLNLNLEIPTFYFYNRYVIYFIELP
jgi:hypothetical protein